MTLSCAIIDDEPLAVEMMSEYVKKTSFLTLDGSYNSAVQAIKALRETPVDLLFLDIPEFLRSHRSYIVHMNKVKYIDRLRMIIKDNFIPISESYKETILAYFDKHTIC